ncbi:MAG: GNAT family N-acetyltransferase [Oscillospiraceae bacterium]|jgi:GNAT superfamily N-acetyltransferase|nr:GNAT family N-acetyltransferase [Oscillospiraceae bacterium]
MIAIEEIPVERAGEFWNIQLGYLLDDGMIETEEEKTYFSSREYRGHLEGLMRRSPDKLHMVYFVRDGVRIGASQYCTYQSEDGKCFILDFWVFPQYRGNGTGHACFDTLSHYTEADGAVYYALNYCKENSRRFWASIGFVDDGVDEYGVKRMVKR